MKVTNEQLTRVKELYAELEVLQADTADKVNHAKSFAKEKIKWTKEGKEVECAEKHLWDEMYFHPAGLESDAGKALSVKYPEAFEAVNKQNAKVAEIQKFTLESWGIKHDKIKLTDIIEIVEAMIDLKLSGGNK